jgi:hypothetical protein
MSLESRAKEATLRAKGDAEMVEVPEVEGVMRERRHRHRTKQAIAGAVVVVVLVGVVSAAVALRGSGGSSSHPQVVTQPQRPVPLEFREVKGELPYGDTMVSTSAPLPGEPAQVSTCEGGALVTPSDKITPEAQVVLPDKPNKNGKHQVCYALGPRLLDGSGIGKVDVTHDPSQGGYIIELTFKNDDFVNKVARPEVNKDVAIVVDGVVQSAPKINPGITGRNVQISGSFTHDQALALGAYLLGVKPSQVQDQSPTTNTLGAADRVSYPPGLAYENLAACPTTSNECTPSYRGITAKAITASDVRHDPLLGWVVDVGLTPSAFGVISHEPMTPRARVDGAPVALALRGHGVVLSALSSTAPWAKSFAETMRQAVTAAP